jgi:hypothetical protein
LTENERTDSHFEWVQDRVSARLDRKNAIEKKVGVVGSSGRAGQAAQGIASVAIPGDLSEWRSPVRSRVYGALTPGSGPSPRRLLRRGGKEREYRCPEGYQFGGRFTDSKWSTCGRQLFDLPNSLPDLLDLAQRQFAMPQDSPAQPRSVGRALRGQEGPGGSPIASRMAQIPRVGSMSKQSRQSGVDTAVRSLTQNPKVQSMLIRRDGFPMQPVVSTGELRQVPDNRNMEDAAFLLSASDIDGFGGDELGLLSNTGVTTLVYVMPNGSTVRMDRTRPLSVGERRKLGKTVSSASEIDNSKDPLARLQAVVDDSDGAISLKPNFVDIKDPDAILESGKNEGKPRWVDEAFKGSAKTPPTPGRDAEKPEAPETPSAEGERISNVENAIEHINNGGNLGEIDPSILPEAVRRAKVYKQRKLGSDRTLFQRSDGGVSFIETRSKDDFEQLSAHSANRVQEAMGLISPKVRITGEGNKRNYFIQTPDSLLPDAEDAKVSDLSKMPPADLAGILASDYLLDVRDRNPSSLMVISSGDQQRAIATSNVPSGLTGLSKDELEKRRELDFPDYLNSDGKSIGDAIRKMSEENRQTSLEQIQNSIERARAFEWDQYLEALKVDGVLSPAEERHLNIVRQIFENRLETLESAQERLAELLGASE